MSDLPEPWQEEDGVYFDEDEAAATPDENGLYVETRNAGGTIPWEVVALSVETAKKNGWLK